MATYSVMSLIFLFESDFSASSETSMLFFQACFLNQSKKDYAKVSIPSSINTFVKVSISVLGPESARISPAVARTFAPTFSFHVDFPVNVVQDFIEDDEHDESSTLAYHLESGFLHVQILYVKHINYSLLFLWMKFAVDFDYRNFQLFHHPFEVLRA